MLHAAGLSHDQLPSQLFQLLTPGGFYCLSDGILGRVDAVFVDFRDSANEVVASWLIYADDHGTEREWQDYLKSFYGDQGYGVQIFADDHAILAARTNHPQSLASIGQALTATSSSDRVSLWRQMQPRLAAENETAGS